jgi:hypothetical protein
VVTVDDEQHVLGARLLDDRRVVPVVGQITRAAGLERFLQPVPLVVVDQPSGAADRVGGIQHDMAHQRGRLVRDDVVGVVAAGG